MSRRCILIILRMFYTFIILLISQTLSTIFISNNYGNFAIIFSSPFFIIIQLLSSKVYNHFLPSLFTDNKSDSKNVEHVIYFHLVTWAHFMIPIESIFCAFSFSCKIHINFIANLIQWKNPYANCFPSFIFALRHVSLKILFFRYCKKIVIIGR